MGFYLYNCHDDELVNEEILPAGAGVYIIRAKNWGGTFHRISRLNGIDNQGVVYIGKSKRLRYRVQTFRNVIFRSTEDKDGLQQGHVAANRYTRIRSIGDAVPAQRLWVQIYSYYGNQAIQMAGRQEKILLRDYMRNFGEVPPLNFSAPYHSTHDEWGEPEKWDLMDE